MTTKLMITKNIGVLMSYPTVSDIVDAMQSGDNEVENSYNTFSNCIVKIFDDDKVYTRSDDFDDKELKVFIESLPTEAMVKFSNFFETVPKIEHEVDLETKDGKKKKITLSGIKDFF